MLFRRRMGEYGSTRAYYPRPLLPHWPREGHHHPARRTSAPQLDRRWAILARRAARLRRGVSRSMQHRHRAARVLARCATGIFSATTEDLQAHDQRAGVGLIASPADDIVPLPPHGAENLSARSAASPRRVFLRAARENGLLPAPVRVGLVLQFRPSFLQASN